MKRQSERDSSPGARGASSSSSSAKRPRERERDRDRERGERERERGERGERERGERGERERERGEPDSSGGGGGGSRRATHKSSGSGPAKHQAPARARDKPRGGSSSSSGSHRDGRGSGDSNHRTGGGGGGGGRSGSGSSGRAKAGGGESGSASASSPGASPLLLLPPLPEPPAPAPAPPPPPAPAPPPPPPEYKTLLISSLSPALPAEHLEDRLFHQFKRFGEISLRLSHTPELGRVAYVNFRHPQDARDARHHARARQLLLYDRPLKVEPVYLRGSSSSSRRSSSSSAGAAATTPPPGPPAPADPLGYLPLHGGYQYKQRSLSPVGAPPLREPRARHAAAAAAFALDAAAAAAAVGLSRDRALDYYGLYDDRGRPYGYPAVCEEDLMPEDDQRATRNLFIGNLDHSVSEVELRRAFEKYGIIEEVVIKRPARGQGGAYAFLKFQNLDMAHRAKVAMSGRVVGRNPIKIGYGKANPTTRLWVGGLGPNTSLAALAREFDRFGSIRTIDHVKGDSFAYIQYESLDAAQAACVQMRGFPLGGPERRLRVDFAKAEETRYPQQCQATPLPVHYELLPEGYTRHRNLEADLRVRDRTPPHLLYSDRDRSFVEGDWASPSKSTDRRNSLDSYSRSVRSRSGERWGSEGDRGPSKPWEERRKRRSLSSDHGRTTHSPYEERGRTKASGLPSDRSPERPRRENHTSESGAEKESSNSLPNNRHGTEERGPDSHQVKKRDSERNHRTSEVESKPLEEPKPETKKLKSLSEYAQTLQLGWNGLLVLKNSCFPTCMHILEGDLGVISGLLKDHASGSKLTQLKIAQRLRLDQPKLDEVTRRIKQGSPNGYVVLLATQASPGGPGTEGTHTVEPGLQRRLLRNLVSYLKQKQAAGVISLPVGGTKGRDNTGMLYAFPPCEFSQQYLQSALRTLGKLEEEHMVIVIVRDTA
ncbi:putative RNA-binding protein 15B [Monodelphis domestica]|uniref:putative RNA-binding protein 15B n=1 Tax=Monodelphis domestica TaxID=13616 RepID=UPI0024E24AA9|nr:putative RNA-binding protein 15B [Monodelphis domestica]